MITKETITALEQRSICAVAESLGLAYCNRNGNLTYYKTHDQKTGALCCYPDNTWFDYATGEKYPRHSTISLVQYILRKNFKDAVEWLCQNQNISTIETKQAIQEKIEKYSIYKVRPYQYNGYAQSAYKYDDYITSRCVSQHIAEKYLLLLTLERNDVKYSNKNQLHFLAIPNISGGYELRTPMAHPMRSFGKKDISIFYYNTDHTRTYKVLIFEGMFDFLSYATYFEIKCDVIVLNSVAIREHAVPYIKQYRHVHTCLDNDFAGQDTHKFFEKYAREISFLPIPYDFKDVNDFHCNYHILRNLEVNNLAEYEQNLYNALMAETPEDLFYYNYPHLF